jgi:PBP1b-binding outer membrane lipoprotein LpoB
MKQLLITIAAVVLVGCGESQQSVPQAETKPVEPVAEASTPETPTVKAPDISIHEAASKGNIEVVKQHWAAGADVNSSDKFGRRPLELAIGIDHTAITELLIINGANINTRNENGLTALNLANLHFKNEIADLLRKHGGKTG